MFGDLVRSCSGLFRGDLLAHPGWPAPQTLVGERALGAPGQQPYRRSASSADQGLVNTPRPRPNRPGGGSG